MRVLTLPSATTLKIHCSITELATGCHIECRHWLVRDAGIGSGVDAIERHFA